MFWITGANGLLGSSFKCKAALHLIRDPRKSLRFTGFCIAVLHSGRELDIGDIAALRAFVKQNPGITHVINCAAFTQVDAAEEKREEAIRTNGIGPENLALVIKEIGAKLIHISTDYVFPGNGNCPLREEDPVAPCNFYGQTKLEGEQRALALGASVIRTSWVFGTGGKSFVNKLLQMLQTEKEIRLTHDQWGRFTYAPDFAEAVFHMFNHPGLYHYANGGIATKYEFGVAMREEALLLGYPVITESILPVPASTFPSPCKRPTYSALDTTKIEKFVTIRHWREALRDFLCAQLPVYS